MDDDEARHRCRGDAGHLGLRGDRRQYQVSETRPRISCGDHPEVLPDRGGGRADRPRGARGPENGDSSTTSAAYAAYIIDLAGDEWDEEAGTWASEDGAYASALSGEEFTADSASYAQAQKAYAVASQEYATKASSASQDWTAYVSELFAKADLTVYGLYA